MGDGLEEDPVVKELILLARDVQLGQLQALLGTHVLGWVGEGGRVLGPGREGGTPPWGQAPSRRRWGRGRSICKEAARPRPAHLLKEPDVEGREGGVQQVEEGQEPSFVQRLLGRRKRGSAFRRNDRTRDTSLPEEAHIPFKQHLEPVF